MHHRLFNNQLVELSSSSEIDNITPEVWEVISKKNPTVGLPEVSNLIDSAISKRQGDRGNMVFLRKRILNKKENGFTMKTQKYYFTWWIVLWSNQLIKMFSMQCKKKLRSKITIINNFINIYTNISSTYIIMWRGWLKTKMIQ